MHSPQVRTETFGVEPKKDGGVDVLVPVKNLGTDHVVVSTLTDPSYSSQEYAIIVAVEESTNVSIDDSLTIIKTLKKRKTLK